MSCVSMRFMHVCMYACFLCMRACVWWMYVVCNVFMFASMYCNVSWCVVCMCCILCKVCAQCMSLVRECMCTCVRACVWCMHSCMYARMPYMFIMCACVPCGHVCLFVCKVCMYCSYVKYVYGTYVCNVMFLWCDVMWCHVWCDVVWCMGVRMQCMNVFMYVRITCNACNAYM